MKWRIQFVLLVALMSGLILGGIHLAEKGTQRIDGVMGNASQSFHISRVDNGALEMTVLGNQYALGEDKQDPASDQASSTNWVSSVGNGIGHWIAAIVKSFFH